MSVYPEAFGADRIVWRTPALAWGLCGACGLALAVFYGPALAQLAATWNSREEYSFGMLVPFISAFLLYQRRDVLATTRFEGSASGVALVLASLAVGVLGRLSTMDTLSQYAFLLSVLGVAVTLTGWRGLRLVAAPLVMLCFMVPLPDYLLRGLSEFLQLVSSNLGVWVIRLAGISVYLEGNVIDLGSLKLQVVEACSGLRYLLPLMTLGFIAAYFYKVAAWKRVVLFLSTIPVTVVMNSLRIALVGVTSEMFGRAAAEGFIHDFEGWAVFMACMLVLGAEMWLLARLGGDRRPFAEVFGIELPAPLPSGLSRVERPVSRAFAVATGLAVTAAALSVLLPRPETEVPVREDFSRFPLQLGAWSGRPEAMEAIYLRELKLDDYLLANYVDGAGGTANVYVAWYAAQREGISAHSPRACLPGDGWEMLELRDRDLPVSLPSGQLRVTRAVIQKGESRQLVYYWFQQRGRVITGEYNVKLYLFWDLLTRRRSDGAMVRLVTAIRPGEPAGAADSRLSDLASQLAGRLPRYIPD